MDYTYYDQKIQDCIEQILRSRIKDTPAVLAGCKKLFAYGKQSDDSNLMGFACYYAGESCYFMGDSKQQLYYLFNGLEYLRLAKNYDLEARAYNLLGILSNSQGNPGSALDYFLQGLSICLPHNLYYTSGMIYADISILFMQISDYQKAIAYLEKGIESYSHLEATPDVIRNLTASYLSIGQNYLHVKNLAKAEFYMKKTEAYLPQIPEDYIGISIWIFRAMLADAKGETSQRDLYIQKTLTLSLQKYSLSTFYDDFLTLLHFLQSTENYQALEEILEPLQEIAVRENNLHFQLELLKIRLEYYRQTGKKKLFLQSSEYFFDLSLKQETENQKIISSSLDLRFSLLELQKQQKQIEDENEKLIIRSQYDALTGLPNRYKLNDSYEAMLTKALQNQASFAAEILDVDYFKQYNDTYGHQAGDDCLMAIARKLQHIMEEDIFCARYGGDEFIILYYNKTREEVLACAEKLRRHICDLRILHESAPGIPYVTITQGIVFRPPKADIPMWDFLHDADNALYEGKKNARNTITLKTFDS